MTDLEHKEIMCVINLLQLSDAVKSKHLDVLPDPHSEEAMKKKDVVSTATQNASSPPPRLLLLTAWSMLQLWSIEARILSSSSLVAAYDIIPWFALFLSSKKKKIDAFSGLWTVCGREFGWLPIKQDLL
jgi:hypothetical protein